jgi:hypothetical protein
MSILIDLVTIRKCDQLRSVSTHKQTGEPLTVPIQVKCLAPATAYEPIIDNVTGKETLLTVCAEHTQDLNPPNE